MSLRSRPEYWGGQPFPSPKDLPNPGIKSRSPTLQVDSLPTESQGKPMNTGVGSLSLLQGIFLTQESNWSLLHYRQILYQLSYRGSPSLVLLNEILLHYYWTCLVGGFIPDILLGNQHVFKGEDPLFLLLKFLRAVTLLCSGKVPSFPLICVFGLVWSCAKPMPIPLHVFFYYRR